MQTSDFEISLAMFELLYWRKNYRIFHGKLVPISFESWAFYSIISSITLNMSSLIVCRLLAFNYQANNHYNRAIAKCPIFLFRKSRLNSAAFREIFIFYSKLIIWIKKLDDKQIIYIWTKDICVGFSFQLLWWNIPLLTSTPNGTAKIAYSLMNALFFF